jgi:hypothetical protein
MEDREMSARCDEHFREVAASRSDTPATDEQWWNALEQGQLEPYEGTDPETWGPWSDLYIFVAD